MKFTLSTAAYYYPEEAKRIPLEKLGFRFVKSDYKAYHISGVPTIEINSLEELIDFSNKWGSIIVEGDSIEIYNGYRE
jgi:hypothetical protein